MHTMSTIHGRLKQGREALKKDQRVFADKLGLSQPAYSNRESGVKVVTYKELEILEAEYRLSSLWVLKERGR